MAVGFPVKDDYATGDVLTAANMNDFAGTLNTVPALAVTQNFCIGGGFDIWQRGTSFTTSSAIYTADRWYQDAAVSTTATQQTTGAPNGARYVYRMELGATGGFNLRQVIETADVVNLQGKTVTFSCLLRRNATYTDNVGISIAKNSTVNAAVNAAGYSTVGTTTTIFNADLPTATGVSDWIVASNTVTIPNDGTANTLRLRISSSGSSQSSGAYLEVALVQIEIGSTRTNFNRAGRTIQGELAACQRYYFRQTAGAAGQHFSNGNNETTTKAVFVMSFPTIMRIAPTALEQSGTAGDYSVRHQATSTTASAVPAFESASTYAGIFTTTVASGLTAGNGCFSRPVNTSAFLGWSAEL